GGSWGFSPRWRPCSWCWLGCTTPPPAVTPPRSIRPRARSRTPWSATAWPCSPRCCSRSSRASSAADMKWLLDQILGWLTAAIVTSLDEMFKLIAHSLLVTPEVTGLPQVQALTGRSTWVVDTAFVLAFIAVGAITMGAGSEERARYTAKDLTPRLIVGFIAAHFSQL